MKVKEEQNKLILTWEKGDEIKVGESITINLKNNNEVRNTVNNLLDNMTEEGLLKIIIFIANLPYSDKKS